MTKHKHSIFGKLPPYSENTKAQKRLDQRSKCILEPFVKEFKGARVLDLGCHDGRWAYAMASLGASKVIGIEGRQDLLNCFSVFPDNKFKSNVELVCGDLFEQLDTLVSNGSKFDIVAVFGIFYHVMDHFRLLKLVSSLEPRLVIIDSEFIEVDNAMIQVVTEDTSNPLNAIPQVHGQSRAVIGIPSTRAVEFMASALGYELEWINKDAVFGTDHDQIHDYFRNHRKVRSTCYLTPR